MWILFHQASFPPHIHKHQAHLPLGFNSQLFPHLSTNDVKNQYLALQTPCRAPDRSGIPRITAGAHTAQPGARSSPPQVLRSWERTWADPDPGW